MQILVDSPQHGLTGLLVLKLYDRRFASQLRSDNKAPPWSDEVEQQFREFVESGQAKRFIDRLNSNEDLEESDPADPLYFAKNEAYLFNYCLDSYETETEVYDRVKDVQGVDVPSLKARVKLMGYPSLSGPFRQYFDVQGIILEYIDGFPLTDLAIHAPREAWQPVCEDAIRIVNLMGDRDIRNEDVKTRNFLVRKNGESGSFKVFIIDFALCEFRGPEQSDEEWRKEKWAQDEEGAVGCVMQDKLKDGFVYKRSLRYWSGRDETYD